MMAFGERYQQLRALVKLESGARPSLPARETVSLGTINRSTVWGFNGACRGRQTVP